MQIFSRIQHQASFNAAATALISPDSPIRLMSYGRLIRVVDRMAVRMREVGVGRWGIVGLHIADPMLHALAALSLLRLSVASVTLPDARVPHGLPVEVIFSDQSSGARSSNIREISFSWLNDEESSSRSVIELVVPVGEFARVMLTSGSTGFPKAVPISWQDLAWRLASYDYAYGSGFAQASRRLLNFMSLNSSLGYMYLLYVLQRGGTMCFPSAEFELTVAACNGYRIEGLVSSPITLSEIVRAADGRRGSSAKVSPHPARSVHHREPTGRLAGTFCNPDSLPARCQFLWLDRNRLDSIRQRQHASQGGALRRPAASGCRGGGFRR